MASTLESYWTRSWKLLTRDEGWIKPLLVLAAARFVPIVGPFGADGYGLEWARLTSWGVDSSPKQKNVDIWACVTTGARAFVVALGYGVVIGIVTMIVNLVFGSIFGGVIDIVIGAFTSVLLAVVKLRSAIYQQVGAGYEFERITDMVNRDSKGLLSIVGMSALISLAIGTVTGIVTVGAMFVGMGGTMLELARNEMYEYVDDWYVTSALLTGLAGMLPFLLVFSYVMNVAASFSDLMVKTAVGLWMRQFDVRNWGSSSDPLPSATPGQPVYGTMYGTYHAQGYGQPNPYSQPGAYGQQGVAPQGYALPQAGATQGYGQTQAPSISQAEMPSPYVQPQVGATQGYGQPQGGVPQAGGQPGVPQQSWSNQQVGAQQPGMSQGFATQQGFGWQQPAAQLPVQQPQQVPAPLPQQATTAATSIPVEVPPAAPAQSSPAPGMPAASPSGAAYGAVPSQGYAGAAPVSSVPAPQLFAPSVATFPLPDVTVGQYEDGVAPAVTAAGQAMATDAWAPAPAATEHEASADVVEGQAPATKASDLGPQEDHGHASGASTVAPSQRDLATDEMLSKFEQAIHESDMSPFDDEDEQAE